MKIKDELYYMPPIKWLSDEIYTKLHYYKTTGKRINLKNPQTYMEKVNWIKLYHHNPMYTQLVDKAEVKKYVAEKIGEEYVTKALGVYDSFEEVDFSKLPTKFVMKCTHDSGGFVICEDKASFDYVAAKRKLEKCLKRNYYYCSREWPYKNVKPRILVEEYVEGLMDLNSTEYKVTCCHGKVGFYTICTGIAHTFEERKNDFYDVNHNHQPFHTTYNMNSDTLPTIPKEMDKINELSVILSNGFPHVRVDWYIVDGQIRFGEMTFYSWGGFFNWNDDKYDLELGKLIDINSIEKII